MELNLLVKKNKLLCQHVIKKNGKRHQKMQIGTEIITYIHEGDCRCSYNYSSFIE